MCDRVGNAFTTAGTHSFDPAVTYNPLLPRKSGMPLAVDTPAPVNTTQNREVVMREARDVAEGVGAVIVRADEKINVGCCRVSLAYDELTGWETAYSLH